MTHRVNYRKSHEADVYNDLRQTLMSDSLHAAVEEARAKAEEAAYIAWYEQIVGVRMSREFFQRLDTIGVVIPFAWNRLRFDTMASAWAGYEEYKLDERIRTAIVDNSREPVSEQQIGAGTGRC